MKQKLLFSLTLGLLTLTTAVNAQSCDPWIIDIYKKVYRRTPTAEECNIKNYNNGSWNNYNELTNYIKAYNDRKKAASNNSQSSTVKGDQWIIQAYLELANRTPNVAEMNIQNYNGGSWNNYNELKNYVQQYGDNMKKHGININFKDVGNGQYLVGYLKNNQLTALNLVSADGGRVVAAGGANVVAAGGMNLRDAIASFIRDNGGMVIAPGGGNILNINNANLTQVQIASAINNIAGAGFGGTYRVAAAGEAIIPASGKGALIFK